MRPRPSSVADRWRRLLEAELVITITTGDTWLAVGLALLLGMASLGFGTWVARTVGLLKSDAPDGETLGVGLACGLIVLSACWAAIWSGGRSSFTPVAIGFAVAIAVGVVRRARRATVTDNAAPRSRSLLITILVGGLFVVAIALLYASTIAPGPRDAVQPIENPDHAFYAVLGRDLATSGAETNLSASGFTNLPGLPAQTWYHWGELWLAAAAITIFGVAPMAARYLVVLPLVLLAVAALSGTLVRRLANTTSRRSYAFGFLTCLFLAPVPLIPGPFFSSWAFGMILGITLYGLGAVAAVLTLYVLTTLGDRTPSWGLGVFAGSVVAFILPAHIVIAALALAGAGFVLGIRIVQSFLVHRRSRIVSPIWRRPIALSAVLLFATAGWALLSGHGLGGSGGSGSAIAPFNSAWTGSVAITALGAGMFLAIPVAWILARTPLSLEADIYLGTMALVVAGAIAWGWQLGDFNTFYLFFGGIAVFATPVAAVAVVRLLQWLRVTNHLRLAAGLVVLSAFQLGWGAGINSASALSRSGPLDDRQPIPIGMIDAIKHLPAGARLAYACRPFEEATFAQPQLLSIDLHTGRRVVPMCFEADAVVSLIGGVRSPETPNTSFDWAPQRELYPVASARPSSEDVAAFLTAHGIGYIYADRIHPNTLVTNAVPIASIDGAVLLKVP
jgi:hypothetical protein